MATARDEAKLAKARAAMQKAALENVAFDGFVQRALDEAAKSAKVSPDLAKLAFPGGPRDLLRAWSTGLDDEVEAALKAEDLSALKIRERIKKGVQLRIERMAARKATARRAAAYLAIPTNAALGAEIGFRTADCIWRGIGDKATDFNYYTKRALLAGVYSATLLFWFSDDSDGAAETWAFLDRRIENVMAFERAKAGLKAFTDKLPDPFKILGSLRYPSRGP